MSASSRGGDSLRRYSAPAVLALVSLAFVIAPAPLKPLVATLGAAVSAGLLLLASAVASRPLSGETKIVLLLACAALAAMLAGVVSQPAPLVSLAGVVGQHNGWAMWASATAWFAVGALVGQGRPFRLLVWTVAGLGALLGLAALLDPLLADVVNYSPEPSGLMENSISLAQLLLLGAGASAALTTIEARPALRWTAWVLTAIQIAALAVSGARAAQVLGVLAVVAAVVLARTSSPERTIRLLSGVALIALIAGVAVVGLSLLGSGEPEWMRQLLTGRPAIWRTALSQVPGRLLVGGGPDRFTSIVEWRSTAGGITWQTTNSPHSVVLDWLLSGGIFALLTFAAAFVSAARGLVRRLGPAPIGPKLLALGIGAWALSLLVSWVDPFAAALAALLTGALLSSSESASVPAVPKRILLGTAALVLGVVVALSWPLVGLEAGWARDHQEGTVAYGMAQERWQRWPDPAFGSDAVQASLQVLPDRADQAGQLAHSVVRLTPWDLNGIAGAVQVTAMLDATAAGTPRPEVGDLLALGMAADPVSGMWEELSSALSAGAPDTR